MKPLLILYSHFFPSQPLHFNVSSVSIFKLFQNKLNTIFSKWLTIFLPYILSHLKYVLFRKNNKNLLDFFNSKLFTNSLVYILTVRFSHLCILCAYSFHFILILVWEHSTASGHAETSRSCCVSAAASGVPNWCFRQCMSFTYLFIMYTYVCSLYFSHYSSSHFYSFKSVFAPELAILKNEIETIFSFVNKINPLIQ